MGFGIGVFFLALGAILAFAVNIHISGIDLSAIGVILMLVGGFCLVLAFSMFYGRRRRTVVTQRRSSDPSLTQGDRVVEERRIYEEPAEPYEPY
ncbi:MAG TPA: DUF6458 family protein [Mycobacteriales bacterium]|nr:DUF6458 family protein [Mycobacteriales bacterium]